MAIFGVRSTPRVARAEVEPLSGRGLLGLPPNVSSGSSQPRRTGMCFLSPVFWSSFDSKVSAFFLGTYTGLDIEHL